MTDRFRSAIASIREFWQNKNRLSVHAVALQQVVKMRGSTLPNWQQWKELPRFLNSRERMIGSMALLVLALSMGTFGVRAWLSNETTVPAIGGSYTEGAIGTPQYINPLFVTGNDVDADLTRLIYSGLMRTDGNHNIVPDLAESYTVSDDQKTYTFNLRRNALWHDGEAVTSRDVAFTIGAIQNPDWQSRLAVTFFGVTVTTPDDYVVVFTLDAPFSAFLASTTVGIIPEHLWADVNPQNANLAQLNLKPIGSGPFKFSKLVKDSKGTLRSYTLARNPNFYRGTVYLDDITIKFYNSIQDLTDAVKNKNVEGASVLPAQDAWGLANDKVIRLGSPNLSQFTAAFFNTKKSTALANKDLRQALWLATDRTRVAEVAAGTFATPIVSPILSDMPGFNASLVVPGADVPAAKAIIDSKKITNLTFTITTLDSPDLVAAANELQAQWQAIGAVVDVLLVDQATLQSSVIKNHDYDVLLAGERYGIYPDLYPFWHSSQASSPGLNLSGFTDRKVDTAIAAARTSNDPQKAIDAANLLASSLNDSFPAVMLYQPKYLYAVSLKLHNTNITSVSEPSDRFANVDTWYRNVTHKLW